MSVFLMLCWVFWYTYCLGYWCKLMYWNYVLWYVYSLRHFGGRRPPVHMWLIAARLKRVAIWCYLSKTCLCAWPKLDFPGCRHSLSIIQLPVANRLLKGVCHWAGQIPAPDTHSTCQLGKRPPSLDPVCVLRWHCVHLLTYNKLLFCD